MKRQIYRQRRRRVAHVVTSVALVGALVACSSSTGDDAESPAPESSAPAETSEPAEADSETPAEDTSAAESEESAETDSDEPLNFAKDPSLVALFGQSVDTWGVITTAEEPEEHPELAEGWEAGGVVPEGMDYITVEITVENTLDVEIPVTSEMSYNAFSGTSDGEYLSNEDESQDAPLRIPAGRTATWIETFAVEDADDVYLTVTTSTGSPVPFVTQTQMDLIEGEVSSD